MIKKNFKFTSLFILLMSISFNLYSDELLAYERNTISVFEKASPSVVFITSKRLQRDFFSMDVFEIPQGTGSGFIWDKKGHIVTNFHVIQKANNISVTLSNGKRYNAKVIGVAPNKDLAVIKVDVPEEYLVPLTLGNSEDLKIGQTVVAIGNPFNLSSTMTLGIVSAKSRTLESFRESSTGGYFSAGDLIQTDAAINPGNSGGPLLNLNGEVIGINRAIRTEVTNELGEPTNSGIGFAISSNIVSRVVPFLIEDGYYDYPYVGI